MPKSVSITAPFVIIVLPYFCRNDPDDQLNADQLQKEDTAFRPDPSLQFRIPTEQPPRLFLVFVSHKATAPLPRSESISPRHYYITSV